MKFADSLNFKLVVKVIVFTRFPAVTRLATLKTAGENTVIIFMITWLPCD